MSLNYIRKSYSEMFIHQISITDHCFYHTYVHRKYTLVKEKKIDKTLKFILAKLSKK